jgi:hypothetical protein
MYRILSTVLLALLLAACDTPKVGFKYTGVKELSVAGHEFKVYFSDTQAQSIRLNNVGLRQRQSGANMAVDAIELASGCTVKRIDRKSDAVLVIARIKCPKA